MLKRYIFYKNHHAKNMIPSPWLEQRKAAHGGDAKSLALEMHQHINKIRALRKMSAELPPVWDIMHSILGHVEKQQKSFFVFSSQCWSLPWSSWGNEFTSPMFTGAHLQSPPSKDAPGLFSSN